jgi:hypothetical protein
MRRMLMGSVALAAPDSTNTRDEVSPAELDAALAPALDRYRVGTLVGCALAEAVVLFGFVAAFLSQELLMVAPNWLLGASLMAIQLPRWQGVAHLLAPGERAALYSRQGLGVRA